MKSTEQKAIKFISENNLIQDGDRVLVALSGGPDSVFLLHFIIKFSKKFKIKIGGAHINHKLRGNNSDRDEIFCEAICNELSIPFYSIQKDVKSFAKKNKLSIEVAARKVRYDFFNNVSSENYYNKIITAHNANDNVETVLLNLIKGAGLKGISGIPVKRKNIVRPILCLSKKEILDYLEENQFEYRIDESNLTNDYERNFLRNEIIPLLEKQINPALTKSVLNTSLILQSLAGEIDEKSENFKSKIKIENKISIKFPIKILNDNAVLNSYFVKQALDDCFDSKIESSDIKKIFSLVNKQSGKSEELSARLIALKERNEIIIKKKTINKRSELQKIKIGDEVNIRGKIISISNVNKDKIKFNNSKNLEYISADNIKNDFTLRSWKLGDKFLPIGMKGTKKVSDYLNDVKINSFEKENQLILENKGKIVWIVGRRLDERYRVTSNTKKVLQLCQK
jgi:tRNA(Ile)-lysidine synthase